MGAVMPICARGFFTSLVTDQSSQAAITRHSTTAMRAVQFSAANQLALVEVPEPNPSEGEVIVALRAAALNHRDVWIKKGEYAGVKWPCIPGSDGAGVVTRC